MNPHIRITNLYIDGDGENRIRFTITIPRDDGESLLHGNAAFDEAIEIPIDE